MELLPIIYAFNFYGNSLIFTLILWYFLGRFPNFTGIFSIKIEVKERISGNFLCMCAWACLFPPSCDFFHFNLHSWPSQGEDWDGKFVTIQSGGCFPFLFGGFNK